MNDDLRTIQRVLNGDVDAFRLLVERYQGPLFSMVGNLVRDKDDRDDITQETFLAAYLHLGSYDPQKAKFSTWLLTIARNKCIDGLKQQRPVTMEVLPPRISPRASMRRNATSNSRHGGASVSCATMSRKTTPQRSFSAPSARWVLKASKP